jgi:hypothetical protein
MVACQSPVLMFSAARVLGYPRCCFFTAASQGGGVVSLPVPLATERPKTRRIAYGRSKGHGISVRCGFSFGLRQSQRLAALLAALSHDGRKRRSGIDVLRLDGQLLLSNACIECRMHHRTNPTNRTPTHRTLTGTVLIRTARVSWSIHHAPTVPSPPVVGRCWVTASQASSHRGRTCELGFGGRISTRGAWPAQPFVGARTPVRTWSLRGARMQRTRCPHGLTCPLYHNPDTAACSLADRHCPSISPPRTVHVHTSGRSPQQQTKKELMVNRKTVSQEHAQA